MTLTKQVKDYYSILGVAPDASQTQIEQAYNKLAVQHHPKKNKSETLEAHKKFKDVCQAYHVLGNNAKRAHYDYLIKNDFSLEQAEKTFHKFYQQFGVQTQDERQFFSENYPHKAKDYYHVLGISRNASLDQIQNAYRKLALAYHPRRNADNQEAKQNFVEVNEAYKALSCDKMRNSYNQITFKALEPVRAHQVFDEFFSNKVFDTPEEEELFRPMLSKKWIRSLDKLMDHEFHQPTHQHAETKRVHQVYENKNGIECRKVIREHKKVKDGKVHSQKTEEYIFPNGEKEIRKTIKEGDKVQKKVYHLKNGEDIPKEIENNSHQPIELENHHQKRSVHCENHNEEVVPEAQPVAVEVEQPVCSKQHETGHQTEVEGAN